MMIYRGGKWRKLELREKGCREEYKLSYKVLFFCILLLSYCMEYEQRNDSENRRKRECNVRKCTRYNASNSWGFSDFRGMHPAKLFACVEFSKLAYTHGTWMPIISRLELICDLEGEKACINGVDLAIYNVVAGQQKNRGSKIDN